jgi:predicted outer membrane repeat protein
MNHRLLAVAALSGAAVPATADVINVPADVATIQKAIAMASDGDEVVVGPGTWNEPVDLLGKAITLRSADGAAATILDGGGAATVLHCENGETELTVVSGFTITGGASGIGGGGIRIFGSSPTIEDCIVQGNTATFGGGIYVVDGAPSITGCTIESNTASFSGGGLYVSELGASVTDCVFTANVAEDRGGAVYNFGASPSFFQCVFSGNTAASGGAISVVIGQPSVAASVFVENQASEGDGGALELMARPVIAVDCVFERNHAAGRGGAIYSTGSLEPTLTGLIRCRLLGNTAEEHGGGMNTDEAVSIFALNTLFSGNAANGSTASRGGAVASWDTTATRIFRSCTLAGNVSTGIHGGLFDLAPQQRTVRNCILYGNQDGSGNVLEAQMNGALLSSLLDYSCVEGLPDVGNGNVGDDPAFVDPAGKDGKPGTSDDDLSLTSGSPCVDAGSNSATPPGIETDLAGQPRFRDDPKTPDTGLGTAPIVDMGALELQPGPLPCDADVDGDGVVDTADLDAVLDAWGPCKRCPEDVDGSGAVDVDDLIAVILGWGVCPE